MWCAIIRTVNSAISLAEEFEQLDRGSVTPPVVLQLPSEMSHDSSSTHMTSDYLMAGDTSTEWSPMVGQSPLMSPSLNNSYQMSPEPHLESCDSRESPIPMRSHETHRLYRSSEYKGPVIESHDPPYNQKNEAHYQRSGSPDHTKGSHDKESKPRQKKRSLDHMKGSHDQGSSYDAYVSADSFSCPNLSTLENYAQQQRQMKHYYNEGHSAIWDDRYHDNCTSMTDLLGTDNDHDNNHHNAAVTPGFLPSVAEESSPSTLATNPPSHVYKVIIGMASLIVYLCWYGNRWCI